MEEELSHKYYFNSNNKGKHKENKNYYKKSYKKECGKGIEFEVKEY